MKTESPKERVLRSSTDFSLILSRLEKQIIRGEKAETCALLLKKKDVWSKLDADGRLRWAGLAQMAGDMETAVAVLEAVNREQPEFLRAWEERLELLFLLGRGRETARVLALARAALGEEDFRKLPQTFLEPPGAADDGSLEKAAAPFDEYRSRQDGIAAYMRLFCGREDCFARQWADKGAGKQGYVPVRRPLESGDVEEHLAGRKTYGIYLLDSRSQVRTGVVDADLVKSLREGRLKADDKARVKREVAYLLKRMKELSLDQGLHPLAEFSGGKGFHFWFLFSEPVDASLARQGLESLIQGLKGDLSAFQLEVFPKQDRLSGKGLGNLVKLPLGVHRLSGKPSFFLDCHDRSIEAQLDFIQKAAIDSPDALRASRQAAGKILVHPRWKEWAETHPGLAAIESRCPPLAQIISSCRQGNDLSLREEKVLYQTIGFLGEAKKDLHHLLGFHAEYNPHMVDYHLSRLRGKPMGCKRIHSLLEFSGEPCRFEGAVEYDHPLLHIKGYSNQFENRSEKIENLQSALDNLQTAIRIVERFMR
ncbi:MAG: CRISPR-associated primase-polymerase type A1 [Desulfatiglandales bacterium]